MEGNFWGQIVLASQESLSSIVFLSKLGLQYIVPLPEVKRGRSLPPSLPFAWLLSLPLKCCPGCRRWAGRIAVRRTPEFFCNAGNRKATTTETKTKDPQFEMANPAEKESLTKTDSLLFYSRVGTSCASEIHFQTHWQSSADDKSLTTIVRWLPTIPRTIPGQRIVL